MTTVAVLEDCRTAKPTHHHQPPPSHVLSPHPDSMPDVYGLICDGHCMEPLHQYGQTLVFSKIEPWQPGDLVALFRRPEYLAPGESPFSFKQLLSAPPASFWTAPKGRKPGSMSANIKPLVMVRQLNPQHVFSYEVEGLYGIHKLVGVISPSGERLEV